VTVPARQQLCIIPLAYVAALVALSGTAIRFGRRALSGARGRRRCVGEWRVVALTLALAAGGRLVLAAQGWPGFDSDESIAERWRGGATRHGDTGSITPR
jgi:hypothetical protein